MIYCHQMSKEAEKKKVYTPIPEGAFEKISLRLKNVFLKEITDVSNNPDLWIEIEDRAGDCKLNNKQIAMQYYLRDIGHIKLSKMIVDSFPAFRGLNISEKLKEQVRNNLGWDLLELYPKKYQEKFLKEIEHKITLDEENKDIPF
jgi:hypothetical protein